MSKQLLTGWHYPDVSAPIVTADPYLARVDMSSRRSRGPVLTRRRLRFELRQFREAAQLTLDHVAREMVWSTSKIVRIENGVVGVSVNDTKALLALYGVTEPAVVKELLGLASDSRRRMWWAKYREHVPSTFLEFVGLEDDASRIQHYSPFVVPGLLQTPEYARAIADNDPVMPGTAEQVDIRMNRQGRLLGGADPPRYIAVLDESVLYRRFGDDTVLRDQLNALLDHVREPHIEVVIVPTDTVGHPGLAVGFVILEFEDPKDSPIVFHDQAGSDVAAETPEDVARYVEVLDRLLSQGLRENSAIAVIKAARDKTG